MCKTTEPLTLSTSIQDLKRSMRRGTSRELLSGKDFSLFYDSDIYLLLNPAAYESQSGRPGISQHDGGTFRSRMILSLSIFKRKEKVAGHLANYIELAGFPINHARGSVRTTDCGN